MTDIEIVRRYKAGASIQTIQELSGLKREEVREVLVSAGIEIVNGGRRLWSVERAKKLYEQGYIDREIGESMGVTSVAIYKWRKKEGLISQKDRRRALR